MPTNTSQEFLNLLTVPDDLANDDDAQPKATVVETNRAYFIGTLTSEGISDELATALFETLVAGDHGTEIQKQRSLELLSILQLSEPNIQDVLSACIKLFEQGLLRIKVLAFFAQEGVRF